MNKIALAAVAIPAAVAVIAIAITNDSARKDAERSSRQLSADNSLIGTASVIDGDTLDLHGQRIRLYGIDAPESSQPCTRADGSGWRCGQQSALALSGHIGRQAISCEARDKDRYGRTVAICHLSGDDLGAWMVSEGMAVAYRKYAMDYVPLEEKARQEMKGIWQGPFVLPEDYRKGNRGD